MIVVIGGDHRGFELKSKIAPFIETLGHTVRDIGCPDESVADFVPIVKAVAEQVLSGTADRGILFGATGAAEGMTVNRIAGIRAAVCHDFQCAHQCVEHDNANVMILGGMVIGSWVARDLTRAFLDARFLNTENFRNRLKQLAEMEKAWPER